MFASDYELANLLIEVAARYPIASALPATYVAAAQTIDSDYQGDGCGRPCSDGAPCRMRH